MRLEVRLPEHRADTAGQLALVVEEVVEQVDQQEGRVLG
ncbi:hypothetical protein ACVWW5_006690 [Bradyrhizobium sp. LM3.4]